MFYREELYDFRTTRTAYTGCYTSGNHAHSYSHILFHTLYLSIMF